MERKGAEDVPAGGEVSAANDEFADEATPVNGHAHSHPHLAWDPYEVWRTRVKSSAFPPPRARAKHERDSR
ncbi:MAG: hypothetical protein JO361_04835 [Gammaproteobacteria bacterium]|nr:hypothetical protein [Gammaproteobacteria bacterium]